MTVHRINPPIEVEVIPHPGVPGGKGWAHFLLDYAQHSDALWQVFLRDTGESWFVRNKFIRHAQCSTWQCK